MYKQKKKYVRVFLNLEKFRLEQSNSKQLLNGNVSVAVIMPVVPGTSLRNNQIKKKSKMEEESKIVIYNVRQNFLYNLTACQLY